MNSPAISLAFSCFCFSAMLFAQNDAEFNPKTVIPKPFKAIKNAKILKAGHKDIDVEDDELVIGIEINGHSRAYPINMLNGPYREIINDSLGDVAIATTW